MKNIMTKTLKTLAVAGMTMAATGLGALSAQAEERNVAVFTPGSATTNYYGLIADAVAEATPGQTIMLLTDVTLRDAKTMETANQEALTFAADKTNTLDLAGRRLSAQGNGDHLICNWGVLTVVDSSPEKTGQLFGGSNGIDQWGTFNMYGGSITNSGTGAQHKDAATGPFTVGGDARIYSGIYGNGLMVTNGHHIAIARGEHAPTDRMMISLYMFPVRTGVFVRAGAKLSDLPHFKSDMAQYYVKYIPGDSADNGQLALDNRSVAVTGFSDVTKTNYTFSCTVTGGVEWVWFDVKNAKIKTTQYEGSGADWSWAFTNKVSGTATNAFVSADVGTSLDAIMLRIAANDEASCQAALTDALSHVIIGNIENGKATLNVRPCSQYTTADWVMEWSEEKKRYVRVEDPTGKIGVYDSSTKKYYLKETTYHYTYGFLETTDVPIPEFRKNVVDTLEDVADRCDGKYSLREVVTDYAFAWDNASNVVIGVSASDNPFELSSDLILASNVTVSANTIGLAGLGIKEQPGNIVIADGVSVTMNCALNAYAAKGSAITNCVVFGTNACVRMDQKFMNTLGCYVKSTDDLFEKGEIKIFEPAGTKKTLEEICKNTYAYDPDGKGYTTVVNDGAIYLKAPPRINFEVSAPEGATAAVYKNAVDPANKVEEGDTIFSNSTAFVVYTVTAADKFFENGRTAVTNRLGTATDPATDTSAYVPTKIGTPQLLLGIVAQRYPWDGKVDVQYKAQFVPAGTPITVTVTLPDGKTASETYGCQNGKGTVVFDARTKFGEVQVKGAKVTAKLSERK